MPGWGKRGLPANEDRRLLARTYLGTQAQLWPEMVKREILPAVTDQVVQQHADAFEKQYVTAASP